MATRNRWPAGSRQMVVPQLRWMASLLSPFCSLRIASLAALSTSEMERTPCTKNPSSVENPFNLRPAPSPSSPLWSRVPGHGCGAGSCSRRSPLSLLRIDEKAPPACSENSIGSRKRNAITKNTKEQHVRGHDLTFALGLYAHRVYLRYQVQAADAQSPMPHGNAAQILTRYLHSTSPGLQNPEKLCGEGHLSVPFVVIGVRPSGGYTGRVQGASTRGALTPCSMARVTGGDGPCFYRVADQPDGPVAQGSRRR